MSALIFNSESPARRRMEAAGYEYERQSGRKYERQCVREARLVDLARKRDREARRRALIVKAEARLAALPVPPPSARLHPSTIEGIVEQLCAKYRITMNQLMTDRAWNTARIRQEGYWLSRVNARRGPSEIARFFHKDHSTVIHGILKHAGRLSEAPNA